MIVLHLLLYKKPISADQFTEFGRSIESPQRRTRYIRFELFWIHIFIHYLDQYYHIIMHIFTLTIDNPCVPILITKYISFMIFQT